MQQIHHQSSEPNLVTPNQAKQGLQTSDYPAEDAEVEGFSTAGGLSPSWCTLGEDGAEDSGVAISSMSAYGFPPFLLKALLKELRNCRKRKREGTSYGFNSGHLVKSLSVSQMCEVFFFYSPICSQWTSRIPQQKKKKRLKMIKHIKTTTTGQV